MSDHRDRAYEAMRRAEQGGYAFNGRSQVEQEAMALRWAQVHLLAAILEHVQNIPGPPPELDLDEWAMVDPSSLLEAG